MKFDKLFSPESIAIIGVSRNPSKVGYLVLKNLIDQGYKHKVFGVNNKFEGKILGKQVFNSLSKIQTGIDLIVLAVPADVTISYLDEINVHNIKNIVIYSAGFKETGTLGLKREKTLIKKAKEYKMNILGPNCLGYIATENNINLTFLKQSCPKGNIAFISQSGALGSMLVDYYASHNNLGFSYFVSLGNKATIDESDMLEFVSKTKSTDVIGIYIEDVKNGEKFKKILKKISRKKPIVLLKGGVTDEGSKAASSHTGGMVGDEQVFDAVCKQYGVIRAESITEFIALLKILSFKQAPPNSNVLVLSNAGGAAVLLSDKLIQNNLKLITISDKTKKAIRQAMGNSHKITLHNPIDVLGDASAFDYKQVISQTIKEKDIGSIFVLLTPQANTEIKKTAEIITSVQKHFNKPIFPIFMGEQSVKDMHLYFEKHKIASFYNFDIIPKALSKIIYYKQWINQEKDIKYVPLGKLILLSNEEKIKKIINLNDSNSLLNLIDSIEILKLTGVPVSDCFEVEKQSELEKTALKIGYPLVAKLSSDKVIHKTEVKGVITDVDTHDELFRAYRHIKSLDKNGKFILQKMVKGYEIFIGAKRDSSFGIVLVIGIGGIFTELIKDVSFRVLPFSYEEFLHMLKQTKVHDLSKGFRRLPEIEVKRLYEILIKVGLLLERHDNIEEIDINPLMISEKSISAVDCRIILKH